MGEWQVEIPLDECLERLEWQLKHLRAREGQWAKAKPADRIAQDRQSRSERAFVFVFCAGALEDLFRRLDTDLPVDLKRVELRRRDLYPSALVMLTPTLWDGTGGDRVARLVTRSELIEAANEFYKDTEPFDFKDLRSLGITDGRTVQAFHFEAVWRGLSLGGGSASFWKSAAHRQSVMTLADKRNTIAHFNTDPRDEAFRLSYGDLATMVERVAESVEHLREHLLLWLDRFERAA